MALTNSPRILLFGFEHGTKETVSHIPLCRDSLLDALKLHPGTKPRIHKSKCLFIVEPNKQHFKVWGSEEEMHIEFVGHNQ